MKTIAVFNQKGGVGKTTTALNLASAGYLRGATPLLLDLDPQGHLTAICGEANKSGQHLFQFYKENTALNKLVQPWPGVGSLIASNRELIKVDSIFGKGPTILNRLKLGLEQLSKSQPERTLTIVDCCPYIGVLALNAIFAADLVIIPVGSDYLSLQGALQVNKTLNALEPVVKRHISRCYLLTNFDKRRNMTFDIQQKISAEFSDEVCQTVIGTNVAIATSPSVKKSVFQYSASSQGARDYANLYTEISARLVAEK